MVKNQKSVFVTGGSGLLGSHLLFSLASTGEKIKALHRQNSNLDFVRKVFSYYTNKPEELFQSIEWVESDICDYDSLKKTIQGSNKVYHCAATVSFDSFRREALILNNTLGTANIVKACLEIGAEKLCHVSSTAALGASGNEKMVNESHQWNESDFHSAYSISKYRSESEVWDGIRRGLCATIVNPSVIFGPGNWRKGSTLFFSKIAGGMPFYTTGVTGYVDVRDVVTSMIILMNSSIDGERFIISAENLSFKEVFSMIAGSMAVKKPYISVPKIFSYPASGVLSLFPFLNRKESYLTFENLRAAYSKVFLDNGKIKEATGISFIPIQQSVEDTSRIYKAENPKSM
jgi:dihydroflavonol-4-reductase